MLRRVLVADESGGYADIVFFADEAAIAEVVAAEQASEVCHEFMGMWDDAGSTMYRVLHTYE